MRILIVDTCYSAFQSAHYATHPGLESQSYHDQWRALMGTFFGTSDAYSHYLAELGHEAHEIVVDCEPLQRAWVAEHAADLGAGATPDEIVLRQARWFEPDVVYFQNLHVLQDETLESLRRQAGFVAGQIASEAPGPERCRKFDLILTSFPHFVEAFRAMGARSDYFRIGFDPRVLDALGDPGDPVRDVVFVGALNGVRHRKGNRVLDQAARHLPIDFFGYDLRGWMPWAQIRRRYRGEAWGIDMFRTLQSARISLNRHIGVASEFANNMRLYEATGVGSLLLTDERTNLHELFEPGVEIATYRSADELVEKAGMYLDDEGARQAMAKAGQARTLRDHTYGRRMEELVRILEDHRP